MLTPPRSSVGSGLDGWWDTSSSLTAPGEAAGGVFLLRVVARGVGSCFWLRQDPRRFVPRPAFPKPGLGSRMPEAGSAGLSVWVLLAALHATGLLCRTGGCPTGGVCVLELLLSPPELPWAMEELMGLSAQLFCWDK